MKKLYVIFLLSFLASTVTNAQYQGFYKLNPQEGFFGGGAGMTWIDNKPYVSVHLFPEFSFANFGVGLDLNLEFDQEGKIRNENFNEFSDYLSVIRYVRYGQKNDPLYVRLGALDFASLGHGSIVHLYNNSISYDTRKVGLSFNVDFHSFGLEGVYSSFGEKGVVGTRAYVRPLSLTTLGILPVIGGLELGASYAMDMNKYAGVKSGNLNLQTNTFEATEDVGAIRIFGFDAELPIVKASFGKIALYFDYAEIVNYGAGRSLGIEFNLDGLGLVTVRSKLERRFNGNNYLPSYFDTFYELERFKFDETTNSVQSKVQFLDANTSIGNGYYGELWISVLNSFDIIGSYQRLDINPESGVLHLRTDVSPENSSMVVRAGYDKINIKDEKDLITLDDRSYVYAEVGYKPFKYLLMSVIYQWTFSPLRDTNNNIIDFIPQKKVEPRISFVYPFDL